MAEKSPLGDRYRPLRLLGEGGAGRVWLVEDTTRPGRRLALKQLADTTCETTTSLRREFVTLTGLRHPNLVEVYEFSAATETAPPSFTLEYIDGQDFVATVRSAEPGVLLELTAEALRALAFLHDFGVIHRDLKPANLLVRSQSALGHRLVVLDFGLALRGRTSADSAQGPSGTLLYLAPELFQGGSATRRSDLYGLGAILFEAVFGEPPFAVPDSDLSEFLGAVSRGREIPELPDHYPDGLRQLIAELISPDPAERPATASETLARLNALCGSDHSIDTPLTRAARLQSGDPPGRDSELQALKQALEAPGNPRLVWLTGEAGTGKTRILRWLTGDRVRQGWEVINCGSGVLARIGSDERWKTLDESTLLILDEVESAGVDAAKALNHFAREADEPFKIVAALRPDEVRNAQISALIRDIDILPTQAEVRLDQLGLQSVREVATRATSGGQVSDQRAKWLLEVSEGNPLILEGLLVDGAWETRAQLRSHPSLQESVARRLERLSETTRRWLEAVTIVGVGAPEDLIRTVAQLDSEQSTGAAEEAGKAGLVARDAGSWRPASRVVGERVLATVKADRGRTLHRKAAEMIEADSSFQDPAKLAGLWRGAGERSRSVDCAIRAAELAQANSDFSTAEEWLRFGLLGLDRGDSRRKDLRLWHAELLRRAGRYQEEARALATVLRLSEDAESRANTLNILSKALAMAGRFERAIEVAETVKLDERDETLPAQYAGSCLAAGSAHFLSNNLDEALGALSEAVLKLEEVGNMADQIQAHHMLGLTLSKLRRFPEARAAFQNALKLAREENDTRVQGNAYLAMGILETRAWKLDAAEQRYKAAEQLIDKTKQASQRIILLTQRMLLEFHTGRFDRALGLIKEAESLALRTGGRRAYATCQSHRADCLIQAGRPGVAAELLNTVVAGSKHGVEQQVVSFARITLAEALLETPAVPISDVGSLLREALDEGGEDVYLILAALVVEMERRVRPECKEPFDPIWKRYLETLEQSKVEIEPPLTARAQLAHGQALLASSKIDLATDAARSVIALAKDKDLPAMEARAYALLAEAQDRQGLSSESRRSFEAGRQALDRAAGRIQDESLREDFLNRPVFRDLRRVSKAAAETENRLLTIYEMIRVLNSELDPELLLESMLDMALGIVRAERGMILLRDPSTGEYSVRVARNLEKETIEDAASFSRNVVLRAGSGRAVLAADVENDERLRDLKSVSLYGIRSVLCVPLESRQQIVGAVYLDSRSGGALFAEDDLRFLEAFADHAALALENARARQELELRNERLRVAAERRSSYGDIIGGSAPMQRVYDLIGKVAENALPVLIQGESGTGKELVARAIHLRSPRSRKPFLTENCAAIAETLLESELFGHVKGAFTGADQDRAGLFERAHLGTLFLDEVGDMSPGMQARLLRVIQEGELRRVGGDRSIDVDVRLLVATHRDLQDLVGRGEFREDLFYRLQVLLVQLPPLRERPGDVSLLIEHFLDRISSERGRRTPAIRAQVSDLLERCAWPGNVRQLENTLQRLVLLAGDGPITLEVVESDRGLKEGLIGLADAAQPVLSLRQNEKEKIRQALDAVGGNRLRAAKMLGVSRATIFRKIKQYGLS